jgi:hypothetical protein
MVNVISGLVEIPTGNPGMRSFRCKGEMLKDQCRLNVYIKSDYNFSATIQGPYSKKCAHIKNVGKNELVWWISQRIVMSVKQARKFRKALRDA